MSFAMTYAKHDCSNANSLEQSTEDDGDGDGDDGNGNGVGAVGDEATGAGDGARNGARDGARGLSSNAGHPEVSAVT